VTFSLPKRGFSPAAGGLSVGGQRRAAVNDRSKPVPGPSDIAWSAISLFGRAIRFAVRPYFHERPVVVVVRRMNATKDISEAA
jgi:hypothetical protein